MTALERFTLTVPLLMLFAASVALAEDVWVTRAELQIREGKGAAFAPVATARKGDKLVVVQREGKWLRVDFEGKQGFVYEDAISPRRVSPSGNLGEVLGTPESAGLSAAAAAKGLQPGAVNFASAGQMSTVPLQTMIARRNAITGAEWIEFTREGNVGPPGP